VLTEIEMRNRLVEAVRIGSQKEVADRAGVTPASVSQILSGYRPVSGKIAGALGYRKAVVYFPA